MAHEVRQRCLTTRERVVVVCAWVWLLAGLPFITNSSLGLCFAFPLILLGFVLGLFWLSMTAAKPSRCAWPTGKWWLCVPLIGLLAMTSVATYWGLAARIMLCEAELQAAVDEAKKGGDNSGSRWIGLVHVDWTHTVGNEVYLHTSQEYLDSTGIAFMPSGIGDEHIRRYQFTHLYGNWYRFYWRF